MNKIAKEELKIAVEHKLRFSFNTPHFSEEEQERIITKMTEFWPEFYDYGKIIISSIIVTTLLVIFGIMKYHNQSNWLLSFIIYALSCIVMIGCLTIITSGYHRGGKDKDIFKMSEVARWAMKSKANVAIFILNTAYLAVGVEMFILHYWFVGTALFLGCGTGLWVRKRHNEEIVNRLSKLAKVGKEELG